MTEPNEQPDATAGESGKGERTVEIPAHEHEVARLRQERDALEQQLQRALADTANIRRRQKQEMDDSRFRVLEGITKELLPVLDTFSLALESHEASGATSGPLVEGVKLVRTLLSGALERHGLQEIPAAGQPFDPARHEAVAVEADPNTPEGHVVRVLQNGYMLGERVVRHSRVVVSGKRDQKNESKES